MADTKLTGLTAVTSLTGEELLYVVDDPSGTPASRKITLDNALANRTFWIKLLTVETVADGDYIALDSVPEDGTIIGIRSISTAGTCTATVKIGSTALGGTANSVSTTAQVQTHSTDNAFVTGNAINVTVSGNSGCENMTLYAQIQGAL